MAAQFIIQQEGVLLNQYTEPLMASDIEQMTELDNAYAVQSGKPVIIIADFSRIRAFPPSLITLGIRHDDRNPIRSSRFRTVIVITTVALLERMAAVVSSIVNNQKFVVVHSWDRAMQELARLLLPVRE